MRKTAVVLAALLLASPVSAHEEPYQHDEGAIVKVVCNLGSGSATRVGRNTYISVHHVTKNTGCRVHGVPIEVTYSDESRDFSTFLGPSGLETIPISCQGYQTGNAYIARGYAFGGDEPWFQPVMAVARYEELWAMLGDIFPGMSGGPVIDKGGRIVGTVNIMNPSGSVSLSDTPVCQ